MCEDQFEEFVTGYRDLKGQSVEPKRNVVHRTSFEPLNISLSSRFIGIHFNLKRTVAP